MYIFEALWLKLLIYPGASIATGLSFFAFPLCDLESTYNHEPFICSDQNAELSRVAFPANKYVGLRHPPGSLVGRTPKVATCTCILVLLY